MTISAKFKVDVGATFSAIAATIKTTTFLALFVVVLFNMKNTCLGFSTISGYLQVVLIWSFYTGIVAILGSILIGLPTIIVLSMLNKLSALLSALVCGVIVLIISILSNDEINEKISILFTFYGVVCGYAYMNAYKKALK